MLWTSLVSPAIFALTLVFFIPLAILATDSLHRNAGLGQMSSDFTLQNYSLFVRDGFYVGLLFDTFFLAATVVTICAAVAYPLAYYLVRSSFRFKAPLIFLVVSPLLISAVIRNVGWIPILGDSGLINWLLLKVGILSQPIQLVGNFTGVVIGLVHALLPFMVLSLMTVIQKIEPELEEASTSLGASVFGTFWRVLLPLSVPGLLSGYLLVFTIAISAFVTPGMLGGKRVLVMALYIDQQVRTVLNYPNAATAAVVLMVATAALTLISLRVSSEQTQ